MQIKHAAVVRPQGASTRGRALRSRCEGRGGAWRPTAWRPDDAVVRQRVVENEIVWADDVADHGDVGGVA